MTATYKIENGRFAGKTQEIRDQWDYTGTKYELHESNPYRNQGNGDPQKILDAISKLSGNSNRYARPRKRVIDGRRGQHTISRHKNVVSLFTNGIKECSVNIEKSTIPFVTNGSSRWTIQYFISYVIDALMKNHTGDEKNDRISGGTIAYHFRDSLDPLKGRMLISYNVLWIQNNSLPSYDNVYYPLYDNEHNLWYYTRNKNGGGTIRLSADQLLSTLKLCNSSDRYGTYVCQDFKIMHSNFDNDNTYSVGRKRIGPSTHTNGFQSVGKAINDNYSSSPRTGVYGDTLRSIVRSVYEGNELIRIPDDKISSSWKQTRLKQHGYLPIGLIDRWSNKKAPLVVWKAPVDYAENDFKTDVINNILEGNEPASAWDKAYSNMNHIEISKTSDDWESDLDTSVLNNIGLELRFTNRTY